MLVGWYPIPLAQRAAPLLLLVLVAAACRAEAPAALRVGSLVYTADEVGGLSGESLRSLADVSAFGAAVARQEAAALGEPLRERAAQRSRLPALPPLLAARDLGVQEDALRAAYARQPEWELTVRHLVRLVPRWADAAERASARATAERAMRRGLEGEDFAELAAEYSEEPGAAERGGLLEPAREGAWVEPFWRAALLLQPGEVSPVVETEYGYHVLQLERRVPVPFGEADRHRILATVIPPADAAAAMERWSTARSAALQVDADAVLTARRALDDGGAADTMVLAAWTADAGGPTSTGRYTARDLAVFRASLDEEERERLDRLADAAFVQRVERDAYEAMLAADAEAFGAEPRPGVLAESTREWQARTSRWAETFGFRARMSDADIRAAALRGLAARGQEPRIARLELEPLRPLLWRRYGVSGEAFAAPAASSSSASP